MKKLLRYFGIGLLLCFGLFFAVALFGGDSSNEVADSSPTDTPGPTPTPAPTLEPLPQLEADIIAELGEPVRDDIDQRLTRFQQDESTHIVVIFAIDTHFSEGMRLSATEDEVAKIMELVRNSGIDYNALSVTGTLSTVDTLGNVQESDMFGLSFTKDILDQIQFENFRSENIYTIATIPRVHPLWQEFIDNR